ncbi:MULTISPECIES: hypothetical protein [Mesorhizobium]|uniref:Uncharacterized protein n=1 Tax=Rhizobium loti TaxID=381 RepID=M5ALM4_RHILI|nr:MULTISPECIES: hypothetical protein [Mesorhizobium]QKC73279.1 hypothetical protein EB815_32330 [Mesorhizobium loti]BAN09694.1 conserved hypothetical protein [Mesorhizobium loti NZP2037]
MERRLDDVIAALPEERRERVDARFEELKDGGREPRRAAPCGWEAQAEIASILKIKQPSVSTI